MEIAPMEPPPAAALYNAPASGFAVTSQPLKVEGDVTVKAMTREDSEFAGRMLIYAFYDKMAHAAGAQK